MINSQGSFTYASKVQQKSGSKILNTTLGQILTIFCALLLRFKPLGLDWTREASFQSLRQMPQERAQQFANRVLEKSTKIGKSDKDLMNQFVRGPSNECRTHSIALGPNSFAQAAQTASLLESAKTFGQDDSAAVLQKQETNTPNQDTRTLKQVNSKLKCAYWRREGHHISECHTRESNNRWRQQSNNTQWAEQPQQRPQQGGHNRQPNNLRSVNSDIVCYSCNGRGHFARDCRRLQNQRPNYQSNNNYKPNFQKQGYQRQYIFQNPPQNRPPRINNYQGYHQTNFQPRGPPFP